MGDGLKNLFAGFDRFNAGLKQLQLSRTLNSANEAVEQIRDSELDQQEKNERLKALGQDLAFRLPQFGVAATQIEGIRGAFVPPELARPTTLIQGLSDPRPEVRERFRQGSIIEQGIKLEFEKLKGPTLAQELAKERIELSKEKTLQTQLDSLTEATDPTKAVRSAFGIAAISRGRIGGLQALLETFKDKDEIIPQEFEEIAIAFAAILTRGQPSEGAVENLVPKTLNFKKAEYDQFINSRPSGVQAAAFIERIEKALVREDIELETQIDETVLQRAQAKFGLAIKRPLQFKNIVAGALKISTEDIIIDLDKRLITTRQAIKNKENLKLAMQGFQEAKKLLKSQKKEERDTAKEILKALGLKGTENPSDSRRILRRKVTRGILR